MGLGNHHMSRMNVKQTYTRWVHRWTTTHDKDAAMHAAMGQSVCLLSAIPA